MGTPLTEDSLAQALVEWQAQRDGEGNLITGMPCALVCATEAIALRGRMLVSQRGPLTGAALIEVDPTVADWSLR